MYQEINILPKASASSRESGHIGGGGIIGGPEGNGGSQHDRKCGGGGGGGPLNFTPGFPGPSPDPDIGGGGKKEFHGAAFDLMLFGLFPGDLEGSHFHLLKFDFHFHSPEYPVLHYLLLHRLGKVDQTHFAPPYFHIQYKPQRRFLS